MQEIKVAARLEMFNEVLDFVVDNLERIDASPKVISQFAIVVDEIFVNIASYAYGDEEGEAVITYQLETDPKRVILQFRDKGKPFNPLDKPDPDITLSADERQIGGLGIFIVKKAMDEVEYQYKENHNILTIVKNL